MWQAGPIKTAPSLVFVVVVPATASVLVPFQTGMWHRGECIADSLLMPLFLFTGSSVPVAKRKGKRFLKMRLLDLLFLCISNFLSLIFGNRMLQTLTLLASMHEWATKDYDHNSLVFSTGNHNRFPAPRTTCPLITTTVSKGMYKFTSFQVGPDFDGSGIRFSIRHFHVFCCFWADI